MRGDWQISEDIRPFVVEATDIRRHPSALHDVIAAGGSGFLALLLNDGKCPHPPHDGARAGAGGAGR